MRYDLPDLPDNASDAAVQAVAAAWAVIDPQDHAPADRADALVRRAQAIEIGSLPPWAEVPASVRQRVAARMRAGGPQQPQGRDAASQ